MLYGREPTLPLDIALPTNPKQFVRDAKERMKDRHASANAHIECKKNHVYAHDDHYNVEFNMRDFVLVFSPVGKNGRAIKLLSQFYVSY